jgi:hypothetical protein
MRWMIDAWAAAQQLRSEGIDIRAVTSWSLLGSSGWNTLLTDRGAYESGVYDVRDGHPRPTALAGLLRGLVDGAAPPPASKGQGWWRRDMRLHHPMIPRPAPMRDRARAAERNEPATPPILILGGDEARTGHVAAACHHRGIAARIATTVPALAEALGQGDCWAMVTLGADPALIRDAADSGLFAVAADDGEDANALLDRMIDAYALACDEPSFA